MCSDSNLFHTKIHLPPICSRFKLKQIVNMLKIAPLDNDWVTLVYQTVFIVNYYEFLLLISFFLCWRCGNVWLCSVLTLHINIIIFTLVSYFLLLLKNKKISFVKQWPHYLHSPIQLCYKYSWPDQKLVRQEYCYFYT